jgi:hypothetical protein
VKLAAAYDLLHVNFLAWVRAAVLSSMQFTQYTPGIIPYHSAGSVLDTLQIFSLKLQITHGIAGGFELPLAVYGMVAVRDSVDFRRNILFSCGRTEAQELTLDVCTILQIDFSFRS